MEKKYGPKYKETSANTSKVHQHTSYKWEADHPVTVGLPDYQA